MKKIFSFQFKSIGIPGFIPENVAVFGSFLLILLLSPIDAITGPQVSLHVFYIFPLTLIAFRSSKNSLVIAATVLAISLQVLALISFDKVNIATKIYLLCMIVLSNITIVVVARFARINTQEVARLATMDPLTNLYNRRALDIALDLEIVRQRRYGGYFSVALIDLDGFKKLNDSMGHEAGDNALILLSKLLIKLTRESDTIARIGGDEFVILMPKTQASDCEGLCVLLCEQIANTMQAAGFILGASIGYTTIEHPPTRSKEVLIIADKAMYEAKSRGKGCVVRGYDTVHLNLVNKP